MKSGASIQRSLAHTGRGSLPSGESRNSLAWVLLALISLLSVLVPSLAAAQPVPADEPIKVELSQSIVSVHDGKEVLKSADKSKPGDVIEYRAVYTNVSKAPVRGLVATLPLPEGLDYVAGSSQPKKPVPQVATKDQKFGGEPLMRAVPGKAELERVPHYEYRAIRWQVGDLAPGASVQVRARAQVSERLPKTAETVSNAPQAPPRSVSVAPAAVSTKP